MTHNDKSFFNVCYILQHFDVLMPENKMNGFIWVTLHYVNSASVDSS